MGVVNKAGSWFSYEKEKLGQGREAVKKLLKEKPALMREIEAKIMAQKGVIQSIEGKPVDFEGVDSGDGDEPEE